MGPMGFDRKIIRLAIPYFYLFLGVTFDFLLIFEL